MGRVALSVSLRRKAMRSRIALVVAAARSSAPAVAGQPRPAPSPNRGHVPVGKQPGGVVAFGRQLDEPLETLLLDRGDLGGDDGAVTEEVVEELL